MNRMAKRPGKILHNGMCEHGAFDGCPHGCFDEPSDLDLKMYEEFQKRFLKREFCIGWHPVDSQKKTYYQALYDSWHEAEASAAGMRKDQPGTVFFVEAATVTRKCGRCNGTGLESIHDACTHCHGKGRVRG